MLRPARESRRAVSIRIDGELWEPVDDENRREVPRPLSPMEAYRSQQ